MTDQNITTRIQIELTALKREQTALDKKYRTLWHSGTSTFDLLDDIERVRKRRVELEDALKVMEEFKED
jgi:hypothetical protein